MPFNQTNWVGGDAPVGGLGRVRGAVNAARTGMSEVQLVTRAAQKAEVAIGGTGRFAGTAKHTYTNNL